jgi:CubicO group peptidase (beta-lactamase class C family)
MTSGIGGGSGLVDPAVDAADYIAEVLQAGVEAKPATQWSYSDRASDVMAAVLTEALKRHDGTNPRTMLDYAREKLFDPLGIKSRPAYEGFEGNDPWSKRFEGPGFAWATDRRGRHYGCCMLKLTAPDMLKLGELYLQGGEWHGQRLVPSEWVKQATTAIDLAPYGRMWWTREVGRYQGFAARGRAGQLVLVVPDLDLVVAVSSTLDYHHDLNADELLPLVAEAILPHVE